MNNKPHLDRRMSTWGVCLLALVAFWAGVAAWVL